MVILRKFVWLLATLLASCSSTEVLPALPTQTVKPIASTLTPTPLATPTVQRTATPTAIEATPTDGIAATPTSTPLTPPEAVLKYQSLEVASKLPAGVKPSGSLIISTGYPIYRWNFDHQAKEKITEGGDCPSTSPDGKWLAYCQEVDGSPKDHWLIVESADGQQRKKLLMAKDWRWDFASVWLDNERLVFTLWNDSPKDSGIYPVAVVNPFTGQWQEIASDYPDITGSMSGPAGTLPFVYSSAVYHPSLNLVIYPQNHKYAVLWDRQAEKVLARIADLGEFGHVPLWSPDSKQFVVAIMHQNGKQVGEWIDEWFSVSQAGGVRQLTHFGDKFADAKIGHANWSPDGHRLAFWLDAKPSQCEGQNLVVLELETQQVADYCVLGSGDPIAPAPPPVWSLDSRYIAVESYERQDSPSYVILVDIVQGWAAQIGEDAYPVGWLTEP